MISEEDAAAVLSCYDKLTKKNKESFLKSAQKASFKAKQTLPLGVAFFIVKRGTVGAFCVGESGNEAFAYGVPKESACLVSEQLRYVFSQPTEIVWLTEIGLESMRSSTLFSAYLADTMKRQEEDLVAHFTAVMFTDVEKRLAGFLYSVANRSRTHCIMLTQEEIAKFVGTSREVVTRKLKQWEEEGVVSAARGKVFIKNKDLLKKKCALR